MRRCYGNTYCSSEGLDPEAVAARLASGSLVYAVARSPGAGVAAQVALEPRGAHGLFEHGRAVVDLAHRGLGLFGALDDLLLRRVAPELGARFVVGKAVTTHLRTQAHCRSEGFVPTGLLLGVIPGTTEVAGVGKALQPVSTVLVALRVEAAPRERRLTLPGSNGERARRALAALAVPERPPAPTARARAPIGATLERVPALGIVHLRFGTRAPRSWRTALTRSLDSSTRVLWADVPSEHPAAARAVEALEGEGFHFGAYVPLGGPEGEDVLRLQRYLDPWPLVPEAVQVLPELESLKHEVFAESGLGAARSV